MWFDTLNEALDSLGLIELWPIGSNISYGELVQHNIEGRLISVYRNDEGRYESPVTYKV